MLCNIEAEARAGFLGAASEVSAALPQKGGSTLCGPLVSADQS